VSLRPLGASRGLSSGSEPSPPRGKPSAFAAALRRLARRDHSAHEIEAALLRRGYPEDEVALTLARLEREGLVNDGKLAERTAARRISRERVGRVRVRHDLARRGLDRETVERGLAQALSEVSEPEALEAAARKYWATHTRVPPETRVARLHTFLLRRGFPGPSVRACLLSLWPRLGDAFEGVDPVEPEEP
jgi:regulatory protein